MRDLKLNLIVNMCTYQKTWQELLLERRQSIGCIVCGLNYHNWNRKIHGKILNSVILFAKLRKPLFKNNYHFPIVCCSVGNLYLNSKLISYRYSPIIYCLQLFLAKTGPNHCVAYFAIWWDGNRFYIKFGGIKDKMLVIQSK